MCGRAPQPAEACRCAEHHQRAERRVDPLREKLHDLGAERHDRDVVQSRKLEPNAGTFGTEAVQQHDPEHCGKVPVRDLNCGWCQRLRPGPHGFLHVRALDWVNRLPKDGTI